MKLALQPYPDSKQLDLPWLRSAPAHWDVRRAKQVFRCIDVRSKTGDEELLTVSSADGVRMRSSKAVTMFMAESYVGHKLCWEGDLVVNSLWAWATGLGFSRYHGIISTAYSVYRPLPAYAEHWEYFHHLFRSRPYDWEFTVRSKGIWISRLQMTDESFMQMPVLVPPSEEQRQIVRFIHHIDQRVNKLIKTKRRLIELLNDQKQAILHRIITRGLDPSVPLKPSGIDWLGDVPRHWHVWRLKQLITKVEQGWSPQCDSQPASSNEWGVLKVGCVNGELFDPSKNKKLPDDLVAPPELRIRSGDILVSRANTRELLGLAALVSSDDYRLLLCDKLFRFRARQGLADENFLVLAIRSVASRNQIESATNGASDSMQNIGQGVLKNLLLAAPSVEEQAEIVGAVHQEAKGLTEAINKSRAEIDLIREYRARLVSDVVTGQLDVSHLDLPESEEMLQGAIDLEGDEQLEELAEQEVAV